MSLIYFENLSQHFRILNRREGLDGAFRYAFTDRISTKGVNSYTGTRS